MALAKPSLWLGEPNLILRLALAKANEETCEFGAISARCIEQGLAECEPVTKKPNRLALLEERADVEALLRVLDYYVDWTAEEQSAIEKRVNEKAEQKTIWLEMVRDHEHKV